jgi:hypothetical protein
LVKAGDVAQHRRRPPPAVPPSSSEAFVAEPPTFAESGVTTSTDATELSSAEIRVRHRKLITRRIGALLLLRQRSDDPEDEEWDECLSLLSSGIEAHRRMKVFVSTDGGGLTPWQRARLLEVTRKGDVWVSVVSDSARVPFVGSAVACLRMRIRSFRTSEILKGYEHLRLTCSEQMLADENLAQMDALLA